jgi:8-oxo-dGTP pyrophosphatase MutT (NUDIX family)
VSGDTTEYVFDTRHDRYPVAAHLILRDPAGRILLMRRAGTEYGEGQLAFPAGHVDLGETPTASITRETLEELGITITPASLTPAGVMFRRSLEPRVDFFFTTGNWVGTPRICEPHKCTELVWAEPGNLPVGTLDYVSAAIAYLVQGRHFSEYGWEPAIR